MQTQEVEIQPNVRVVLKSDAELLDEVMVVAFGTAKKSAFTGSAAVVNTEELSKRITTNVSDALVGSVPGLQLRGGSGAPGSSGGNISIRGIASMYAATDPLVIVDGAPYTASLSNIPQSYLRVEGCGFGCPLRCPWCRRCHHHYDQEGQVARGCSECRCQVGR